MITVTVRGGPDDGLTFEIPALEGEEDVRKEINGAIYALHFRNHSWIATPEEN